MQLFKKISNWLATHYRPMFFLLLTGFLVTGNMTMHNAYLVKTPLLPHGTFSWETNTSQALQKRILDTWANNMDSLIVIKRNNSLVKKLSGLTVANAQNNADYGFIFFYTSLLLLFVARLCWAKRYKGAYFSYREALFWASAAIFAGLMDVAEDLGTAHSISQYNNKQIVPVISIYLPAIIKWIVLAVIAVRLGIAAIKMNKPKQWLEELSQNLGEIIIYAWRFRIVLITLLVFVAVLFISDQGQDLLISINSDPVACVYFLITVTSLALLCWHLPKAIDNAANISFKQFWLGPVDFTPTHNKLKKRSSMKADIGRLLGAAAFLVPATGILQTMNTYQIWYAFNTVPPLVILIALLVFYTIVLQHNWIDRFYKHGQTIHLLRYWCTMVLLAVPIIYWGVFSSQTNREPYFLAYLSIDLILLSAGFLITVTLRTCVPSIAKWPVGAFITFGGLFLMLFFIACNFTGFLRPITNIARFYTMPIVFCGVAGYLLLFSFLLFTGKKTGITIITFLMIFSLYVAIHQVTRYHETALVKAPAGTAPPDSLKRYARGWLIHHRFEIDTFTKSRPYYPVFFVNAYGGGIRAAVWATMVMGELDSLALAQSQNNPKHLDFRHYVLSMSGASGGTIGLSLLTAARAAHLKLPETDTAFYPYGFKDVYAYDYLTSDIVALLGRDMLASTFGLSNHWPDRGRLMEEDWERQLKIKMSYGAAFSTIWKKDSYDLPLLFANTYDVDAAEKGVLAPVVLDSLNFPATIFPVKELHKGDDFRLSTAAFLSARFPYVSPTGKLYGNHHFTDGGTWENSGGETSQQVMRVFKRELDSLAKTDQVYKKVKIAFLSLPNSIVDKPHFKREKNLFEPLAPIKGILATIAGREQKADSDNHALAALHHYLYYSLSPAAIRITKTGRGISPVLPLGWQISDYALEQMAASASDRKQHALDAILVAIGLQARDKAGKNHAAKR